MADAGAFRDLPIFELPAVLLPGELMPLQIFEDRYKRMIGDCLEREEPFGIVFRDDDGGARRVGCTARIAEVIERFDDGRLNIVVTGEDPFQVEDRFEEADYPAGTVSPVERTDSLAPDDADQAEATREAFEELVRRVSGSEPGDDVTEDDSYAIAARVELPAETKQALLEQRSEAERMRILGNALRSLLSTLARSREVAERARMNGKVVFE